jgi:hypothetical protein
MDWLIGKLPSISTTSKSFKKFANILYSQHPIQKCKKPFCPLRVKTKIYNYYVLKKIKNLMPYLSKSKLLKVKDSKT